MNEYNFIIVCKNTGSRSNLTVKALNQKHAINKAMWIARERNKTIIY